MDKYLITHKQQNVLTGPKTAGKASLTPHDYDKESWGRLSNDQ